MPKSFFRPQAVAAADRLDALPRTMRVTGSVVRLGAAGLAVLLVGGVVASAHVEVPIRVKGHGVLVDATGALVSPVLAPAAGYVARIHVGVGDTVAVGDPLATLAMPDREIAIESARRALGEAERQERENARLRALDDEAEARAQVRRAESAQERIAGLEEKLAWLTTRVEDLAALEGRGFATRQSLIEARIAREEAAEALLDARAARTALDTEREEAQSRRARDALADRLAVERARDDLAAREAERDRYATLVAPVFGRVSALDAAPGALVSPGARLVEILDAAAADAPLEALVFVAMADGKRLAPGDRTLIAPSSLPEASRDRLVARVVRVSETPVARETLERLLGDADLAAAAGAAGPPFAVTVALETRPDGGYAWTSAGVDPAPLGPGTPLSADVTVERTPLLALALPAVKKLLGMKPDAWSGAPS
ncbi:NHLP bacteriocin system secretion protein [Salinarimonas chemoclinalis]|uniref:NHLP bacteriocin system secretion protein n=1 Tax=Salinarimonas chemoclinalis TaxID=3241599 RepID=UPI003557AD78